MQTAEATTAVPMADIFPFVHNNNNNPIHKSSTLQQQQQYEVNDNGMLIIKSRPDCEMTVYMLPTCLFFGCLLAVSSDVIFDDMNQEVYIANFPGYCCTPPCKTSTTIPYNHISTIGWKRSGVKGNRYNLLHTY